MKIPTSLCHLLAVCCLLASCRAVRQQAYYVSPFNGHPNDYHPIPLSSDSTHDALYVHAAFFNGGANQQRTDGIKAFRTGLSVAHQSGIFQAWGSGVLTLGAYHAGHWDTGHVRFFGPTSLPPANADFLNSKSGHKTFSGVGLEAGANLVWTVGKCDWRYLGVESSMHREFGDYLSFRKKLPDTAATLLIRHPLFATLGFSTEIVKRTENGEFGFRLAGGWALGDAYQNSRVWDEESRRYLHYSYGSFSFHMTAGSYTGFIQFNLATQARSMHLGLHYRLTRIRLPEWTPRRYYYRKEPLPWRQ